MNEYIEKIESIFLYSYFQETCNINLLDGKFNANAYYAYSNLAKFIPKEQSEDVIPRIMHYTWFTRVENPKQIPESFLSNFQLELNKLKIYNLNSSEPWQVKLWINCEDCLSPSLNKISKMGYPVELVNWKDEIFDATLSALKDKVTQLISTKNGMGAAYDIARFIIAEKYGGFLPDFDIDTGNSTEIIVQRGYHSISSFEIDYIGFIPKHKILKCTNEFTLKIFSSLEKLDINPSNLNSDQMAGLFTYGIFSTIAESLLEKQDLYLTPQCDICNLKKVQPYNNFYNIYEEDDEIESCSINPPEICIEAEHKNTLGSKYCTLKINSEIDFGGKNADLGQTWQEEWQEQ